MNKKDLIKMLSEMEAKEPTKKITRPSDIVSMLAMYVKKTQEHFIVITLNAANEIIKKRVITKGLVNRTMIHPREVFRQAIKDNAVSVILAHNHPSGNVNPSKEDDDITKKLRQAGEVIGINVLDHIIIGKNGYYSYKE